MAFFMKDGASFLTDFLPRNHLHSTGIHVAYSPRDFLLPCCLDIFVSRPIKTVDQ